MSSSVNEFIISELDHEFTISEKLIMYESRNNRNSRMLDLIQLLLITLMYVFDPVLFVSYKFDGTIRRVSIFIILAISLVFLFFLLIAIDQYNRDWGMTQMMMSNNETSVAIKLRVRLKQTSVGPISQVVKSMSPLLDFLTVLILNSNVDLDDDLSRYNLILISILFSISLPVFCCCRKRGDLGLLGFYRLVSRVSSIYYALDKLQGLDQLFLVTLLLELLSDLLSLVGSSLSSRLEASLSQEVL